MNDNDRFGLTRDELFATIFALLAGLLMMLGLFRCTPVWETLGFGDDEIIETVEEEIAEVTPVVENDDSLLEQEILENQKRIKELERDASVEPEKVVVTDNSAIKSIEQQQSLADQESARLAAELAKEKEKEATRLMELEKLEQARLTEQKAKEKAEAKLRQMEADAETERLAQAKADADAQAMADAKAQEEARLARLEAAKQRMADGKLFGADEDLAPRARELGKTLRVIHGDGAEPLAVNPIADVYGTLADTHSAKLIQRVAFGSGQSSIDSNATGILADSAKKAGEDSWFVVVGYADKTGNADSNKVLSEKRALSVAKAIQTVEGAGDRLQALYVGETDRFSPTDNAQNRVVEIWEVTPE